MESSLHYGILIHPIGNLQILSLKILKMKLYLLGTLFSALFFSAGCTKNGEEDPGSNTPRTSITADLAGKKWLSQSDLNISTDLNYYTLSVYNSSAKRWFNGERDPWDMRPRPANGVMLTAEG
ncbi:MAG TPA: hypothetical protein VHK69_22960, partial [Chitinophagaceae bacterium]|nr:hypothetical protein [Chitinophagaceae bacterium]